VTIAPYGLKATALELICARQNRFIPDAPKSSAGVPIFGVSTVWSPSGLDNDEPRVHIRNDGKNYDLSGGRGDYSLFDGLRDIGLEKPCSPQGKSAGVNRGWKRTYRPPSSPSIQALSRQKP
jgi:hypothetical protein